MAVIGADRGAVLTKSAPRRSRVAAQERDDGREKSAGRRVPWCCDLERSTRRGFLTAMSVVGLGLTTLPDSFWLGPIRASQRPSRVMSWSLRSKATNPDALSPGYCLRRATAPGMADAPCEQDCSQGIVLNKVLLLHLDPSTLVVFTQERAAEGIVADPAILVVHVGCEVNGWVVEQQIPDAPVTIRITIRAKPRRLSTVRHRAPWFGAAADAGGRQSPPWRALPDGPSRHRSDLIVRGACGKDLIGRSNRPARRKFKPDALMLGKQKEQEETS